MNGSWASCEDEDGKEVDLLANRAVGESWESVKALGNMGISNLFKRWLPWSLWCIPWRWSYQGMSIDRNSADKIENVRWFEMVWHTYSEYHLKARIARDTKKIRLPFKEASGRQSSKQPKQATKASDQSKLRLDDGSKQQTKLTSYLLLDIETKASKRSQEIQSQSTGIVLFFVLKRIQSSSS